MDFAAGASLAIVVASFALIGFGFRALLTAGRTAEFKQCPTCHTSVAASATSCPKCGRRFSSVGGVLALLILVLIVIGVWRLVR